ncbi:hypothetical protein Vi05172_g12248 [Venturia inaequalis]|nr:hypothetical protein Vi05172_g12248 [Venturia inaequalis]
MERELKEDRVANPKIPKSHYNPAKIVRAIEVQKSIRLKIMEVENRGFSGV